MREDSSQPFHCAQINLLMSANMFSDEADYETEFEYKIAEFLPNRPK